MSTAAVYFTLPKINSGALYHLVTTCVEYCLRTCGSRCVVRGVCNDMRLIAREKKEHTGLGIILGESDESVELPGLDTLPI